VPESCWRNFLTMTGHVQHWTDFCGRLTLQGLQTRSPAAAENVYGLHKRHADVCANGDHFEHKLTDGIAYELLRRPFHTGNFCF